MTAINLDAPGRLRRVFNPTSGYLPIMVTALLLLIMFAVGSSLYEGFLSGQVIMNVFIDNAYLAVIAVGMTFVILTGGIDLSVGSVMALSTLICASLTEERGLPAAVAIPVALVMGTVFGLGMGAIIHYFEIQPFIVTLAGMFLARGLCYTISIDSISINNATFVKLSQTRIPMGNVSITPSVIIAGLVLLVAFYVLHYRPLGRNVYAVGGGEQSALLMGLPVARTKIAVYGISGFCSALGGVVFTFYILSGNSLHGIGTELDAIAAVVIGGTLLTGGAGYVLGTLLGVLTFGVIQTIIIFQGDLSSWWTRIVIGVLLFLFIVLQRTLVSRRVRG